MADEEFRLLDIGEVLGPRFEWDVEYRGCELGLPLLLPGVDGRPAVLGARRDVVTLAVEPPVAPDAVDDQRFFDGLVGQQFVLP